MFEYFLYIVSFPAEVLAVVGLASIAYKAIASREW